MMEKRNIRPYDLSVWTLQDEYIATLRSYDSEWKGQIVDPTLTLDTDGTQELTFSIPMFIYDYQTNQLVENPLWGFKDDNLLVNMRKIKVTFLGDYLRTEEIDFNPMNPSTDQVLGLQEGVLYYHRSSNKYYVFEGKVAINVELKDLLARNQKIFEFLIIKINETHSGDELTCEVTCENLAFHELGKIGYKYVLSAEEYQEDSSESVLKQEIIQCFGKANNPKINLYNRRIINNLDGSYSTLVTTTYEYANFVISASPIPQNPSESLYYNRYEDGIVDVHLLDEYIGAIMDNNPSTIAQILSLDTKDLILRVVANGPGVLEVEDAWAEELHIYGDIYETQFRAKGIEVNPNDQVLQNNINYWNEKIGLKPYPTSGKLNSSQWYYKIEMDWSSYNSEWLPTKVYEEEYATAWKVQGDILVPSQYSANLGEKYRIVESSESNRYNLTQDIATAFGVYCRYDYLHDTTGHITGRVVTYYNNFIKEDEGLLSFQYPYSSSKITRTLDSVDLITKLYVKSVSDEGSIQGTATIMNTEANKSREDYILNFDYLYKFGIISQEQKNAIAVFEKNVYQINESLKENQAKLVVENDKKIFYEAQIQVASNGIEEAEDQLNEQQALYNSLAQVSQYTADNPDIRQVITDTNGEYIIRCYNTGIQRDTLHLYTTYDTTTHTLSNEVAYLPEFDEYNNMTTMRKIAWPSTATSTRAYLIYRFDPRQACQNVIDVLTDVIGNNTRTKEAYEEYLDDTEQNIKDLEAAIKAQLETKDTLLTNFELMMGPALREGSWTPENYVDDGERKERTRGNLNTSDTNLENSTRPVDFFWDDILSQEEQDIVYYTGTNQVPHTYPFWIIPKNINNLDEYQIMYQPLNGSGKINVNSENFALKDIQILSFNKDFFLAYYELNGFQPILVLTNTKAIDALTAFNNTFIFGKFVIENGGVTVKELFDFSSIPQNAGDRRKTFGTSNISICYPRFRFNTMALKTTGITLKLGPTTLKEYEDYTVATKSSKINLDIIKDDHYYLTIKPMSFYKYSTYKTASSYSYREAKLSYILSQANTAIYLDGLKVAKENSQPKVSYTVDPSVLAKYFLMTSYNNLNRIVNITDSQLHLENVQGYISHLDLKLDAPWEDTIEVKNYKTKFEDLFSSIMASTQTVQKNEHLFTGLSNAFTSNGSLNYKLVQQILDTSILKYYFNDGQLTIDNTNGIVGTSSKGAIAFTNNGISVATQKNNNSTWKWQSLISPQGINAGLLSGGKINTQSITITAGDDTKFQMNGQGIFAYRNTREDSNLMSYYSSGATSAEKDTIDNAITAEETNNARHQYVLFDGSGLHLRADPGSVVRGLTSGGSYTLKRVTGVAVDRLSIDWNGLTLRNWNNQEVLYADSDTGNLHITGNFNAQTLTIADLSGITENIKDLIRSWMFATYSGANNYTNNDAIKNTFLDRAVLKSNIQSYGYITSGYLTQNGYLTQSDMSGYLTNADLANYATKTYVTDQGYINEEGLYSYLTDPNHFYITNTSLESYNYITQSSLNNYMAISDFCVLVDSSYQINPSKINLSGYMLKTTYITQEDRIISGVTTSVDCLKEEYIPGYLQRNALFDFGTTNIKSSLLGNVTTIDDLDNYVLKTSLFDNNTTTIKASLLGNAVKPTDIFDNGTTTIKSSLLSNAIRSSDIFDNNTTTIKSSLLGNAIKPSDIFDNNTTTIKSALLGNAIKSSDIFDTGTTTIKTDLLGNALVPSDVFDITTSGNDTIWNLKPEFLNNYIVNISEEATPEYKLQSTLIPNSVMLKSDRISTILQSEDNTMKLSISASCGFMLIIQTSNKENYGVYLVTTDEDGKVETGGLITISENSFTCTINTNIDDDQALDLTATGNGDIIYVTAIKIHGTGSCSITPEPEP